MFSLSNVLLILALMFRLHVVHSWDKKKRAWWDSNGSPYSWIVLWLNITTFHLFLVWMKIFIQILCWMNARHRIFFSPGAVSAVVVLRVSNCKMPSASYVFTSVYGWFVSNPTLKRHVTLFVYDGEHTLKGQSSEILFRFLTFIDRL